MSDSIRKDLAYLLEDLFLVDEEEEIVAHIHEILLRLRGDYVSLVQRFKILEEINSLVDERTVGARETALNEDSTFLSKRKMTREYDTLQFAIAGAYISVFSDNSMQADERSLDMHQIATAMHRSMYHLSQLQMWHYQLNSPLPDRLWFNLHLVYRESLEYELNNYPLVLVTAGGNCKNTVEENYKRVLLMGGANTAIMDHKEIKYLYILLEDWVQQTTLHQLGNRADIYSIYICSDQGPIYQCMNTPKPKDKNIWHTLDTTELVAMLQKLHHRAEQQNENSVKIKDVILHCKQIHRLLHAWGTMPHRRFKRVDESFTVEMGFNIGKDGGSIDNGLSISDEFTEPGRWGTLNTSPNGYCLVKKGDVDFDLHPGQLIKVHELREAKLGIWHLAQTRWIKHITDQEEPEVAIGVFLLSPSYTYVEFHKHQQTGLAIILPEIEAIHQTSSIIMPTHFVSGDKLDIKDLEGEEEHYMIQLGDCIDFTSDFIRYHYKRINPEEDPS